ncbi:acetylcholine receptor subunit beta-type acr-3-like [Symsagittifera roscoffensis]|uniref:acetylcholine receptor subunit beta-type acr-3-like n=1 Tax=Symsagittifera roscoffensis TaxID=84072 RepID=UPI00307C9FAA
MFYSLFVCVLLISVEVKTSANETSFTNGVDVGNRLLEKLESVLPKNIPPSDMRSNTVYISVAPKQISHVNEKEGFLTLQLQMSCYYWSQSASWDPADFHNNSMIIVPPHTFWSADIVILNSLEVRYESFERQLVYSSGAVLFWSPLVTVRLACSFDVSLFPFDKHLCPIDVGSWLSTNDTYKISSNPRNIIVPYTENDEWELSHSQNSIEILTRTTVGFESDNWYSYIRMPLNIKRRHHFYLLIFVLPNALLCLLSGLVFFVPPESGEKISFAITILLAQFVSLAMISDILPSSSRSFPKIGYVCGGAIAQSTVNLLLSVIVMNCYFSRGFTRPGRKVRIIISSRLMSVLGLTPCPKEICFPKKDNSSYTEDDQGYPNDFFNHYRL